MTKYTVKYLDNLTKIAKKFGVTVDAIVKANKDLIKDPNVIKKGWVLNIPDNEAPTPEPSEPAAPANPPYKKIGRETLATLAAIEKIPEFNKLMELIKNGNGN